MTAPVICAWDGEAFVPMPRFVKLCDKEFVIGENYPLIVHEDRSQASHRQFFAALHDAWENLPLDWAERFPTSEHLRKYALVRCGYADERSIVCSSKAEAQRIAAFVKPMDAYAVVIVQQSVVKVFTPKSQSTKAMGKKEFQESKTKVLDFVASLIGVTADELAARRAA